MTTDNPTGVVPLEPWEAGEWARLIGQVEDWLLHAGDGAAADYARFFRYGPALHDTIDQLGEISVRLHRLARTRQEARR